MRQLGSPKIDFEAFSNSICAGTERFRSHYYHCPPWVSNPSTQQERVYQQKRQAFFHSLDSLQRFQVRLGKLARRGAPPNYTYEQKRVDILLGVDLVRLSAKGIISKAHIVAGDSDFMPAIEFAQQDGVLVKIWPGPQGTYHQDIWRACDELEELTLPLFQSFSI